MSIIFAVYRQRQQQGTFKAFIAIYRQDNDNIKETTASERERESALSLLLLLNYIFSFVKLSLLKNKRQSFDVKQDERSVYMSYSR